ncbi:hypothetical protein HID58_045831 [Brassica napus]|uniref:Uncharacterized protein n=1 Tax=Brassica napus TaxID=3708 RepID=A0ABQ8AUT9_BRANA|nr:hypothetical protein HID58_045831 [Brassica napus]
MSENWLKESIGNLGQAKEFKGKHENLRKQVTHEAFKSFQTCFLIQASMWEALVMLLLGLMVVLISKKNGGHECVLQP